MDTTASAATVAVECDGLRALWDGADFQGDDQIVLEARRAARLGEQVDIFGVVPVTAGAGDALSAAAALCAYRPGRTVLVENPPEVTQFLDEALSGHGVFLHDE